MTIRATWIGHAAVLIESPETSIVIDPFITGNPAATIAADAISPEIVLLTHDHADHLGDTEAYLKKGATLVAVHEHAVRFGEMGCKAEGMNVGGAIQVGPARIRMTAAFHTAGVGHVVGFLVEIGGRTIHHSGDTGLTMEMKILGEFHRVDLAFLPIGDRYTMGPAEAAVAASWIGAKKVVPIHYNTWPPITANPDEFARRVGPAAVILKPGESIEI
jgi:L-ascorbate metabolism protein UlaG (beta-lactamase superfamily)